jgi:methionyl-tRNA formyltransferase
VTRPPAASGRVRTVFLGSGAFAVPALRVVIAHPAVELAGIVTAPPRPAGRRLRLEPSPVHRAANGLVLTPERLRSPEAIAEILALEPGLVVLADYGQIVPAALLDLPHGALNLHPSLLPRHRGASPIPATILAGDPETGVTLMRMDRGLDTGPIVAVERVALTGLETAPALEARLAEVAAGLLDRSLTPWLRGELTAIPQPEDGATLTRPLRREDGRLDPSSPAEALERQVRAYLPWPGTFLGDGDRLVVIAAASAPTEPGDVPGRLVRYADRPALCTTHGRLVLETVRPAGRREMSGAEWLRGRRDLPPVSSSSRD